MKAQTELKQKSLKESIVDTVGNITYPLILGTPLDYFTGLRGWGIVASRTYATGINAPSGWVYGKYRNLLHKKTASLKDNSTLKSILKNVFTLGTVSLAQLTGSPYQAYSEIADNLIETNKIQDSLVDLVAFNSFQVPLYSTVIIAGSFVSNLIQGYIGVDWGKAWNGAISLAKLSPFIGPTMGMYMDGLRKLFGVKSAVEKSTEAIAQDQTLEEVVA